MTPIGYNHGVAISCVYCGGTHADAAGVRACWQRADGTEQEQHTSATTPAEVPVGQQTARRPEPLGADAAGSAVARRGAALLGRHVVVRPGAPAPTDWADAERVAITATALIDPTSAIHQLRTAALERRGLIIEIDPVTQGALALATIATDAPCVLGARFEFPLDVLHHLVTANSVDATGDEHRWWLLDRAIGLGATATTEGGGDVIDPRGERLWLDGGPLRFREPIHGVPVVHRIAIEHRSLTPFTTNHTAAELAPDQVAAVTHDGGAARIIAPAGSGKTRVLTERARHLVTQWRIPASAICLVAFNKRAQEEMSERTGDLPGLQIRTLNAMSLAIVNGSRPFRPRPRTVSTIDEGEVRRIIGRLVRFPRKRNADPVATWIEALSLARLGLRSPGDVESMYDGDVTDFEAVLPRYRAELARGGVVDFDEQVQVAIELLLTEPLLRADAQRACRVLLVDEFQDLTPAHLLLIRLLAGPDGAVFGVGDDDQTIYGYNGADPAWLIDFAELFPGAGEHPLDVNYRCPGGVVEAASTLLRHNTRRVPKQIRAADLGGGGFTVHPEGDAVATTVAIVNGAIGSGTPAIDVAVLTRVNSMLAPVQIALAAAGVGVRGGVGAEFADRTAVRAALAWLRLATGNGAFTSEDLGEALRRPSRPLHPNVSTWVAEQTSIDGLRRLAARLTTERESERVDAFADDIESLQRLANSAGTTARILEVLRDSMGLASTIATLDTNRRGMNRAAQDDDLVAIAQLAELQPDPAAFEDWLRAGLGRPRQADGVTLATVHRVKGQEWPIVVVHQADHDQFPHRLADDVEEERRVFHVAITRASREVHVVPDRDPSPFIADCSTEPSARPTPTSTTRPVERVAKAATAAGKPGHGLSADESAVFEALRALRRHLAAGKPAYTVLADAALHQIAVAKPGSLAELARIKGVGPAKLEQYGAAILAVVESSG